MKPKKILDLNATVGQSTMLQNKAKAEALQLRADGGEANGWERNRGWKFHRMRLHSWTFVTGQHIVPQAVLRFVCRATHAIRPSHLDGARMRLLRGN